MHGVPVSPRESRDNENIHGVIRKRKPEWKLLNGNGRDWGLTYCGNIPAQHNSFSHESRHKVCIDYVDYTVPSEIFLAIAVIFIRIFDALAACRSICRGREVGEV